MSIHSRKLTLIEAFIRLNDEILLQKFEQLILLHERKIAKEKISKMTMDEFNQMIDEAERDFIEGNAIDHNTLKENIKTWK